MFTLTIIILAVIALVELYCAVGILMLLRMISQNVVPGSYGACAVFILLWPYAYSKIMKATK